MNRNCRLNKAWQAYKLTHASRNSMEMFARARKSWALLCTLVNRNCRLNKAWQAYKLTHASKNSMEVFARARESWAHGLMYTRGASESVCSSVCATASITSQAIPVKKGRTTYNAF